MMPALTPGRFLVTLVLLLGWGNLAAAEDKTSGKGEASPSWESALKEYATILNDAADTLAKVKDQDSAEKATAEVKAETKRLRKLTASFAKLGKPAETDGERLAEIQKKLKAAVVRFERENKGMYQRTTREALPLATGRKLNAALRDFRKALMDLAKGKKK
jgi:hypothetical protein